MIIISAERHGYTKTDNALRSAALVADLLDTIGWDAGVIPTLGCWGGIEEQCYIVKFMTEVSDEKINEYAELLKSLAMKYDQDAIGMINLDAFPARMSYIDLKTEEYHVSLCNMCIEPRPEIPGWVKMQGFYCYPGKDITGDLELQALIAEQTEDNSLFIWPEMDDDFDPEWPEG